MAQIVPHLFPIIDSAAVDPSGLLPPTLARTLDCAQQVALFRFEQHQRNPDRPDAIRHDNESLKTLSRIHLTLLDFAIQYPWLSASLLRPHRDSETPIPSTSSDVSGLSHRSDPSDRRSSESSVRTAVQRIAVPAHLRSIPPRRHTSVPHRTADSSPNGATGRDSLAQPEGLGSPSAPSPTIGAAQPRPTSEVARPSGDLTCRSPKGEGLLLSPALSRTLRETQSRLERAMPLHYGSRSSARPRRFHADVERLARLVAVHLTLAAVDLQSRRPDAGPADRCSDDPARLDPFVALALNPASLAAQEECLSHALAALHGQTPAPPSPSTASPPSTSIPDPRTSAQPSTNSPAPHRSYSSHRSHSSPGSGGPIAPTPSPSAPAASPAPHTTFAPDYAARVAARATRLLASAPRRARRTAKRLLSPLPNRLAELSALNDRIDTAPLAFPSSPSPFSPSSSSPSASSPLRPSKFAIRNSSPRLLPLLAFFPTVLPVLPLPDPSDPPERRLSAPRRLSRFATDARMLFYDHLFELLRGVAASLRHHSRRALGSLPPPDDFALADP